MTALRHGEDRARRAIVMVAQSSVLVAFALVQHPRWTAPDTKLDLYVDPLGFLQRALSLWDPTAAAGQLQNQAYGYLFPMGPFFVLGQALGLPAWLVQRLWWALLLLLGFHGMRLLLSRMGVGSSTSRALAAFAYALSPRMLEGLGAISSEIWPMAIAPWVLVPLVAHPPGGERRAAARSAVAVLCAGAVNAVATLAILVLPFWWIVTRGGPRRWRLGGWWSLFVALASFWWVGPLLLLGRYSPAFLDWIESSRVTTGGASLTEALRGTTQWIAGIRGSRGPQWPAGWEVLTARPIIFLGMLLIVMGLVGIWQADREWRSFARGGLLGGLVLVTLGSVRPLASPLAPELAALLDGALAPLRNTHKFEPSVRIVLCLGIAHAVPLAHRWLKSRGGAVPQMAAIVVALAIIGQAAFPALLGVSQRGRYLEVPAHWREAATWLASNRDGGRTLVLPGATNPASYWGDSRDEPLQPLAESPWMVRDAVPLGSAGATRLLNDIEARVASGYGGDELRNALLRLGVTRVLVRSDLDFRATGAPNPMTVRAALRSAGASPTVAFGPQVGGSVDPELVLDGGTNQPTSAIAIYSLDSERTGIAPTVTTAAANAAVVAGGPEGTVLLPDAEQPAVLASDPSAVGLRPSGLPSVVLTDTLQRREANFAAVRANYGAVLRADQDYVGARRVHDWLMPWLPEGPGLAGHQTVAELSGADGVDASSSLANPELGQVRELTRAPESAFDASADTFWETAGFDPRDQWITVRFAEPVSLPDSVMVTFDMKGGADVAAVTVRTDRGSVRTPVSSPRLTQGESERYTVSVGVPPGGTRSLRLTVAEVRPKSGSTVRMRDIGAGVLPRVESWLRLPDPGLKNIDRVLMQAAPSRTPRCVPDDWGVVQCQPDLGRLAEGERDLRRVFTLPAADDFQVRGTVYPRGDAATARLLRRVDGVRARASSTWLAGPEVTPALVVDGDPKTYWAADPEVEEPEITLSWPGERRFSGLELETYPSVTGRRVTAVEVTVNGRTFERSVGSDGAVRLPETIASQVVLRVTETTSLDMTQRIFRRGPAPIVIGDISLRGPDAWDDSASGPESAVRVPCGFGPRLQVNGTEYPTAVSGTKGQVVRGEPLRLRVCGEVDLSPGEQRLRLLASAEFGVRTLSLESTTMTSDSAPAAAARPVETHHWEATDRRVVVEPNGERQLLVVRENANAGWQATTGGARLQPVTVDGWSQGWIVPAGRQGQVSLAFGPQRPFLATLVLGGLLALMVVAAALTSRSARTPRQVGAAATWPGWLAMAMTAVALFLLGGVAGVLAGAVVLVGFLPRLRLAAATAMVLVVAAWVGWALWQPWPAAGATNRDGLSQALALVVVAAAVSGVSRQRRGARTSGRGPEV